MRRALMLLLALCCLAAAGAAMAVRRMGGAADDVELTEVCSWGDESAAHGVTVTARSTSNYHLFWDTACTFAPERACAADFRFSLPKEREAYVRPYDGVIFTDAINTGVGGDLDDLAQALEGYPLLGAAQSLADSTAPGETRTETVRVADYLDYYPIQVFVDMPTDVTVNADTLKLFSDFFRVPVQPGHVLELCVTKDEAGNVVSFDSTSGGTGAMLTSGGVVTGDDCYFTFDAGGVNGEPLDTSLIPGGYGIYRFSGGRGELSNVYALDARESPAGMFTDEEGERLLFFTTDSERAYLTVIDMASMALLQRLELAALTPDEQWISIYDQGAFLVTETARELSVLDMDSAGSYAQSLRVEAFPQGAPRAYYLGDAVMSWDGERLCVAGPALNYDDGTERGGYSNCGFYLNVYDADGLRYSAKFASSLDADLPYDSLYTVRSRENRPIMINQ